MTRVKKSLKNAWVAVTINISLLLLAFFSRKYCIDFLGENITGLNSTFSDILGFLNLAELGVLSAVAYSLYKPIFEGDRDEVNNIMSILCYIYRIVGCVILGVGTLLAFFLPQIYEDSGVTAEILLTGYFTFLTINLIGYFLNYRQNILVADQRNWVIVSITGINTIVRVVAQILILLYAQISPYEKYLWYLLLELISAFIFSIIINRKVAQLYPWLSSNFKRGRELRANYSHIFSKIRQVFSHKFGDFVLNKSDAFVISIISSSFSAVTIFTNYTLIFSRLSRLCFSAFDNIGAGIGNLIAEGNGQNVYATYRQLNSMFYIIGGVIFICGYHLTPPFIELWLGEGDKFLLDNTLFIFILLNVYISVIRRINELFLNAQGAFGDVFAPWVEAGLNLLISLYFGFKYGIIGVVLGTTVSTLIIGALWKPYYLYKIVFSKNSLRYFGLMLKYLILTASVAYASNYFEKLPIYTTIDSYVDWLLSAAILTISVVLSLIVLFFIFDAYTRKIVYRIFRRVKR
ncbi:MAG: hypothetical protein R3Y50_00615 [Rikenellaceae bacterium]